MVVEKVLTSVSSSPPPYKNMSASLGDNSPSSLALGSLYCYNVTKTQEMWPMFIWKHVAYELLLLCKQRDKDCCTEHLSEPCSVLSRYTFGFFVYHFYLPPVELNIIKSLIVRNFILFWSITNQHWQTSVLRHLTGSKMLPLNANKVVLNDAFILLVKTGNKFVFFIKDNLKWRRNLACVCYNTMVK